MSPASPSVNPSDRSPLGLLRTARLIWRLLQDARVPGWLKLIVPATLLYLLFPLDILPDFLVGPGQFDDLGVILAGLWLFLQLVPQGIMREYAGERADESNRAGDDGPAVDVTYRVVDEEPPGPRREPPALPSPDEPTSGR